MTSVERVLKTTPQRVWDVFSDGWLYPLWVVGASRMREVDPEWPAAGSRIYHSVGVWPGLINDHTEVLECEPLKNLVLQAKGWPLLGEATVSLTLSEQGAGTRMVMDEDATAGPGKLVPHPIRAAGITWRNTETLSRLAYLAERRA